MRRWTVVLLLLLLPFTMAPRTSIGTLGAGWEGDLLADNEDRGSGPVTTLVASLRPPSVPSELTVVHIAVSNAEWDLLSAPAGCTQVATGVSCVIQPSLRAQHLLRVVVSAPDGARIGQITAAEQI